MLLAVSKYKAHPIATLASDDGKETFAFSPQELEVPTLKKRKFGE